MLAFSTKRKKMRSRNPFTILHPHSTYMTSALCNNPVIHLQGREALPCQGKIDNVGAALHEV